jgi:hypothetical protein
MTIPKHASGRRQLTKHQKSIGAFILVQFVLITVLGIMAKTLPGLWIMAAIGLTTTLGTVDPLSAVGVGMIVLWLVTDVALGSYIYSSVWRR